MAEIIIKAKTKEANQPQQQQPETTPSKIIRNSICDESRFATQKEVNEVLDKMYCLWNSWDEFMENLSEFERCIAIEYKLIKWRYINAINPEKLNAYVISARKWICGKRAPNAFVKFVNEITIDILRKNHY